MVHKLAWALQRVIPDPFAIALALTLVAFALGLLWGDAPALELVDAWAAGARGFWSLLTFAMQMCLILVTGFVVASTRPARFVLRALAAIPRTTAQAAALISVAAMLLALLNWGLGLIAGALLAREVGQQMASRGVKVHYPVLAAAGYMGLCVWHGGLSGSAPLKVTRHADLVQLLGRDLADAFGAIPLQETVLSLRNLLTTGSVIVAVPFVLALLVPRDPERFAPPPPAPAQNAAVRARDTGLAGWLEDTPLLIVPIAGLMGIYVVRWVAGGGLRALDPNDVNFVFLLLGLVMAGSPKRYMEHAGDAARATAGIVVQFPFYGGILGILIASGAAGGIASALPSGGATLPLSTFASAGLLNLFVPSGGGQWSVQGPIVMEAALRSGVEGGRVVMALAYGDQWTNLFQPFWALPLLGITGARAGDILGYTAVIGVVTGLIFALGVSLG